MIKKVQSKINIQDLADKFHPMLFDILNKDLFYKITRDPYLGVRYEEVYGVSKQYKLQSKKIGIICIYKFNDSILEIIKFYIQDLKKI